MPTAKQLREFKGRYVDLLRPLYRPEDARNQLADLKQESKDTKRSGA